MDCPLGGPSSIPGLGKSPGEGNGNPTQYSCLENPMNRGDQLWVFTGRTDAKAETPVLGHLMQRVDSLEKTLMLGGMGGAGAGREGDDRR